MLQVRSVYPTFCILRADEAIGRTPNPLASAIQDMGIDHRRFHVTHSQSLLRPSVFGLTILYLWARRFLSNPLNAIGIDAYDVDRLAYLIRLGSNFHFN